jgi:DNA modification methylase
MSNHAEVSTIYRAVHAVYAGSGGAAVSNGALYDAVCEKTGIHPDEFRRREPIGKRGARHSRMARTARWVQQTMRSKNWLEKEPGKRGVWRLTDQGKQRLHTTRRGRVLIGFSTRLGVALVGDCRDAFGGLGEPVELILCSPPYALRRARAYGNPTPQEYVDFVCRCMEPVLKWLAPGGSLVLNVGQDTFETNSPARSLLIERLTLALADMGLHLMDRLIWFNPSKPPGPVQWASLKRVQLQVGYEPILWMTNDPSRVRSCNQRVLQPHSERQARLIAQGGEQRRRRFSDGRYTLREGSFGAPTAGRIPRNVIQMGHSDVSQRRYKARARALGLPCHGAPMPVALAKFLIEFLTEPGALVVDPMAGSITTGVASEMLDRRWIACEQIAEYVRGGAERFEEVWINPLLDSLLPRSDAPRLF